MDPRRVAVIVLLLIAAPSPGAWDLVGSWPTPGAEPRGMDYGWLVCDGAPPYIYQVNSWNGSITTSFAAPGGSGAWGVCRGSSYQNLFVSNYATSYIYTVTTAGSVVGSFPSPLPGPAAMENSGALYIAFPDQNIIARVNATTGSVMSSFNGPGSRVTACWWNGALAADSNTHAIYGNGVVIISGIQTPYGLCGIGTTKNPGTRLYITDAATDYVFVYYNGAVVEPASLGRVKALFR